MEISKKLKRIISLVLVWVMFTTCIPDSFISVVRAYAEDSTGESQEADRKTIKLNFTLGGNDENSATNESEEKNDSTGEENTTPEDVQLLNDESEHIIFTLYQITTENGLEKKVSATYPDSVKDNTETQSDDSITAKIEKSSDADNKYTVTLMNISPDDSYVYTLQNQKTTDQTPVLLASKTLDTTVGEADITVNANNTDTVAVKGWVTQNVSNDPVSVTYTVVPVIKNGENNVILTDDVLYTETINVGSAIDRTNTVFEKTVTKNDDIKGYAVKFEGDDIKTKLVTANLTDDTGYTVGSENTPEKLEAKAIDLYADFGIGESDLEENETVKGTVTIKKKNENDEYDVINTSQEQSLVGSIKLGTVQDEDAAYKVTVQVTKNTSYKEKEYIIFDRTLDKKSITSAKDTPGNRSYMINDNAKAEKKVELNADNGNVDISITDKESSVNKSEFKYGDKIKISAAIAKDTFTDDELQSNEIQNLTPTIILQYKESEAENWKDITSEDGGYLLNYVGTYQITVSYKETPYSKAAEITKSFTAGKANSGNVFNNDISSDNIITSTNEQSIKLESYLKAGYSIKQIKLEKTPDSEKISLKGTELKIPEEYTGKITVEYTLTSDIYEIPDNTSLTLNVKYGEITDKLISNVKNTEVYSNNDGYQPKVTIPAGYTYKSISFAAEKSSDADNIVYDENKKEISVPGGTEATYTCIFYLTKDDKIYQKTEKITVDTKNPIINFDDPLKKADTVYANESVEAKLSVEESNKDKVSIEVSVDGKKTGKTLDSDFKWTETFALAENETQKIISIHVEITDKVGNSSSSDRKIVLDKIKPVLEIKDSEESGDNEYKKPGDSYHYAKRTVLITVTEDNSFNEEDFCEQLKKAIQVKIKGEDFKFITTDADSKQYYTITDTKEPDKKVYKIEFTGDAYYKMDNFQYKDLAGNVSESSVSIKEFVIDNTKPTADQMDLSYFQATDVNAQTSSIKFFATKALKAELQYATILNNGTISDNRNATFSLTGVQDNLLKVTVSYALENTLIESKSNNDWEKLNWMPITPEFVDSNGNYNVTLDKERKDNTYYIYYKLEDDAGNVSYYDGLGLAWDNTLPVITVEQDLDKVEVATEATLYKSDDVTLNFSIKEKNFDDVTLSVKKDGVKETGVTWKDPWNNNNDIWTNSLELKSVDKEEHVYEIEVACKDKAGNKTTWTSTIYIDRKCPEIKVEYPDNNRNGLYFSKNTEIKIRANDLTLNTDTLKESIKQGITAVNMAGEPLTDAFEISEWNTKDNQYIVTFKNEAIYTINLEYNDAAKNSANVSYVQGEESVKNTFVIDRTAPEVTVTYDKYNSETPHYYKEARSATIEVKDLSYIYYEQNKSKEQSLAVSEIETKITESNPLADADGKKDMHTEGEWSYAENTYTRTVDFEKDGIYILEITGADKLGNEIKNVVYQAKEENQKEKTTITDGSSFVIDRTAPEVTVTYDKYNSETPHYYKEARSATIEVKDLSYIYYEQNKSKEQSLAVSEIETKITESNPLADADGKKDMHTEGEWSYAENTYTRTVDFEKDGIYTLEITGADKLGNEIKNVVYQAKKENQEEKTTITDGSSFVIDGTAPEITVTYNKYNSETPHYYKEARSATIEVKDLSYIYYEQNKSKEQSLAVSEIETKITESNPLADADGKKDMHTEGEWSYAENTYTRTVDFEKDGIYILEITGADKFGNEIKNVVYQAQEENQEEKTTITNGSSFVIDRTAPQVTVTYSPNNSNPHYKENRTATIEVKDLSYIYYDESKKDGEIYLNRQDAALKTQVIVKNVDNTDIGNTDAELKAEGYYTDQKWAEKKDSHSYKKTITYTGNAHYHFSFSSMKDICGNAVDDEKRYTADFWIDKAIPEIRVSYDNNDVKNESYFNKNRIATIEIQDSASSFNATKVKINITARDKDGHDVKDAYTISSSEWETTSNADKTVHRNRITFNTSAYYTFNVTYENEAGSTAKDIQFADEVQAGAAFCVDKVAPTGTLQMKTYKWTELIKNPEAILSYKEKIEFTAESADNFVVDSVKYKKVLKVLDKNSYTADELESWTWTKYKEAITEAPNQDFTIYLRIEDNAGNVTYINSQGIILDDIAPEIEFSYDITEKFADNSTHTKTFNAAEIVLTMKITENHFVSENTVVKINDAVKSGLTWTASDEDERMWTSSITLTAGDNKAESYKVSVSTKDTAGNETAYEEAAVIDRQAPVITLTYDQTENAGELHYYNKARSAEIQVDEIYSLDKDAFRQAIIDGINATDINNENVSLKEITDDSGLIKAVGVKDGQVYYTISTWNELQNTYTVTFSADAIYSVGVKYTDKSGNTNSDVKFANEVKDGASFVIDTQKPVISVEYKDEDSSKTGKTHYYKGKRQAEITLQDLSYLYENTVQKVSIPAPARNKMSSGINDLNLAVDLNGADITAQIQKGEWLFDTNKYTRVVTFEDDAIYEFGLSGWDICKNQIDAKDVSYNVDDGTSFVIDRQAPVIEVTYNDNSENKEKDHYYKGDRKATVTVKDLSCIYENTIQNVAVGADNTGITGIGYSITAKDEKDAAVSDNKSGWVSDGNWSYDSDKRQYTRDIIFTGDAIYTFSVNGTDICGNKSELKDEKSDIVYQAADGTSFVIDTQAPVVTVEYNDSSKLQDHYYSDTRTATISVKDLSYVYENWMEKQNDAAKSDVETVSKRMNITLTAKDAAGNDINAMTQSGWSFADGTYRYVITYGEAAGSKVDAIFTSAFSGNDIYNNDALISYKNSEGDVTDYESFVIDREAPVVTIAYNNSSKKQEHYYSDTRTASLTVYDLSYVYENELAKQADETKTDVDTVGNRMNVMLTAKDAAGNDIDAVTESGWSFANGTYRYVITYGEAGGNKVDAIFTSAFSGNDIYTRRASISYQDSKGIVVTDYESFVIDREAPVVTIEYDDSNKLQDHYYSDTRTAAITVKDISYVYENQQAKQGKVTESDVYTVRNRMNITLTAKNAAGNDIDAVTESGWNFADGAYHYVITYGEAGGNKVDAIFTSTFSGTDIYGRRISISYQDSEEKNVEDSASFVIDRKAPVITVTYTDTGKSKDHFYNADRTAVITVDDLSYAYEDQRRTAKDVLTPQERISLKITARDSLLNALTGEKAQSESNWSFANGKYTRTITFANEAIYDFAISGSDIFAHTTLDEAVGYNTTADNHSFVVDKTGPQVSLAYSDSNRTYYKGSRQAVLTMTDLSMIYNDRILSGTSLYLNDAQTDGTKSDSVKTTIRLRNDDAASDLNNAGNAYYTDSAWSLSGNVYTRTILYTGEAHYTFAIAGTDRCGNTADIAYNGNMDAGEFWIDLTNPTAQISYDNNSQTREIGGRGYFRGLRTATIVITEGISTFDSSKVNISITAKDASGNPVEAHTTMSGWTTRQQRDTGSATTHTLTITYPGDANYDFGISYTDKAGNVMNTVDTGSSMSPYHFTVDTTSPSGSVTVSGLGTWNTLVSYRTFGLWSRTAVDIGAGYQDATSSVYSVEYYKTARTTAMTVSELNALGSSEWTAYSPFTIRPDDQFTIYLRIEDRSGNVTYVSSDGVILDITAPDVESIEPEITVAPVQQPVNGIYNTDVTVDIKVSDPITNGTYSGLKNVHYQVLNMGNVTQEGDLYNFSYTGGSPLQSQLVQQWTDQIIVDRNLNNSNDVQIVISAQDNSGNYASASNSVKIDVTQPQINITYDNNNGDTSFGEATYFKEDRTATIEITERNFNPDDVQITLTNADGAVPSITGWSSSTGSAANGDENVYTTTLTYSADGDYNFDITYADMAGNQNTATDYGSSLAPQVFTVDKTLPVINVSYDNNAATNGNYYSAARTATISITEHNFETGRFTITTTATDNGVSKTAPGISGWTSNGDIHTATVSFTDDAYYTIGMSYTDMAGNQAAAFTEQNFYVDKTMPYVTLQGIRNNSANNGETIGFILTCTDTNFDVFAPVLTVARLVDGQNKVETYSFDRTVSVANGIQYVIDNLPTDGIYSLVCTVYDKAGNAFNKIIYLDDNGQEVSEMNVTDASVSLLDFSVNRDGSAYKLDDATVAMLGSYYIREIGDNIVIYETNVDDLTEYVVELNGKVLEESKDYTVEKSGGNGEWYVKKYIINKDLFEEEGEYKIVIHTKDSVENEAYSDIKGAELSFVVDKTAPEITVSGVENNGRYQVESQTVTVIPTDDGGKLETLDISVLDNNGNPVEGYPVAYKGSTLTDELDKNNGNITFAIPEGTGMSVVIHCSDVAGNEMKELKYTNIVVSTSGLTIFLANKPLFYGTVGGVVAVVGGGSAVIILRRRKLSAGTKTQDDK